ncbi:MAG TPA: outer membrane beta-barrel protein [Acidobacteriaceae bacterium]|nr:outer membrane beta-barrel protein [Terriglobia bacterium]HVC90286.1 outer membrane beta-barrel protein [Acidobacteriaceae bacterium]
MKKLFFLLCLLPMLAGTGFSQDQGMRQDVNLSFMGVIQPYVEGTTTGPTTPPVQQKSTLGTGLYLGYRYLLTPNGAVEANYSYSHFTNKFTANAGGVYGGARVYTGMQEATFAYVRTIPFKKFNPFLEIGGGLLFFTPIEPGTTTYDTEQTESPTVLAGGGVAYQLSPSWDLRIQYRGQIFKTNNFGLSRFSTDRRYIMSEPAIGFAYHF